MPPRKYTVLHRDAALSGAERVRLIQGLKATFRVTPPLPRWGESREDKG